MQNDAIYYSNFLHACHVYPSHHSSFALLCLLFVSLCSASCSQRDFLLHLKLHIYTSPYRRYISSLNSLFQSSENGKKLCNFSFRRIALRNISRLFKVTAVNPVTAVFQVQPHWCLPHQRQSCRKHPAVSLDSICLIASTDCLRTWSTGPDNKDANVEGDVLVLFSGFGEFLLFVL